MILFVGHQYVEERFMSFCPWQYYGTGRFTNQGENILKIMQKKKKTSRSLIIKQKLLGLNGSDLEIKLSEYFL